MTAPVGVTAVVLAAGRSARMGARNKLLLQHRGVPLLRHALDTLAAAGLDDVVVVTGHEAAAVEAAVRDRAVRVVHNTAYAEGMASSIRCGVAAAAPPHRVLLVLGDMPSVRPATLRRLLAAHAEAPAPAIVQPRHAGRPGHPVLFDAAFRAELLALAGDVGARAVLQAHPGALVRVEVDDPGVLLDVDTPSAYAALGAEGGEGGGAAP